jgi:hypothetical protein
MKISAKKVIDREVMQLQRQSRKADVARLYLQGLTLWQIAQEVKVSQNTICKDLEQIRLEWLQSSLRDFDQRKAEELARLERVESEAWAAWVKSKFDQEQHRTKIHKEREEARRSKDKGNDKGRNGSKNTKGQEGPSERARARMEIKSMEEELLSKGSNGDPRFLEIVMKCIDMRLKVIGAYKSNPSTTNQLIIQWDELYQRSSEVNPIQRQLLELAGGDARLISGEQEQEGDTLRETSSYPGVSPIIVQAPTHGSGPNSASAPGSAHSGPIDWEKELHSSTGSSPHSAAASTPQSFREAPEEDS